MKRHRCTTAIVMLILLTLPSFAQPDPTEIIRKADRHLRGNTSTATLSMQIIKPNWNRTLRMKSWSKGQEYAMILITAPARDRSTTFLMREDEVWQWVPSISRTIKIPPSMMMQSWMGSDFTNNDLVQEASIVEDYTHTMVGDTTIRDREAWVIRMEPKPTAPVVWEKVMVWITKKTNIQLRAEYYGEDGELVNTLHMENIQEMGGRQIPTRWVMIPADEEGQRTIMTYESIEFNTDIPDSFFSIQNMKRLRP